MQAYITNIKLSGIKNIDKEISLDFYKKTKPNCPKFTYGDVGECILLYMQCDIIIYART